MYLAKMITCVRAQAFPQLSLGLKIQQGALETIWRPFMRTRRLHRIACSLLQEHSLSEKHTAGDRH